MPDQKRQHERRDLPWYQTKWWNSALIIAIAAWTGHFIYKYATLENRMVTVEKHQFREEAMRKTFITRLESDQHKLVIQTQIAAVDSKADLINTQVNTRLGSIEANVFRILERMPARKD